MALLALPDDETLLIQHWTLSPDDLAVIVRRRRPHNRLGFAIQLCALRYPGRLLRPGELIPHAPLAFVAEQLRVEPEVLADYAMRGPTRYEQLDALRDAFGFTPLSRPRHPRTQQRRGGKCAETRHLLPSHRPCPRSRAASAEPSGERAQPRSWRNRLVEHHLPTSGPDASRQLGTPSPARSAATSVATRLATHQSHRRLSLDRSRDTIGSAPATPPDPRRRRSGKTLAYIWARSMYRPHPGRTGRDEGVELDRGPARPRAAVRHGEDQTAGRWYGSCSH